MGLGIEAVRGVIGMMSGSKYTNELEKEANNPPFPECKIEHQNFHNCLKENPELCYDFYNKLSECIQYKSNINMSQ